MQAVHSSYATPVLGWELALMQAVHSSYATPVLGWELALMQVVQLLGLDNK